MMIAGTNLTASANENDGGYTIVGLADQTLDENGMGDVMSPDGNFRVHMDDDGNLMGRAVRRGAQHPDRGREGSGGHLRH